MCAAGGAGSAAARLRPVEAYLGIVSRREVRDYAAGPLSPEVERRILDAGRLAGSAKNRQPWTFVGPQATLFHTFKGTLRQQATTHFLSADPSGTLRPAWQHSLDSSVVWGRVRQSSADPNYVEAGAIAWLLVEAAATAPGPIGGAMLAHTAFIQRLNTSGGVAPSTGCSASQLGAVVLVPYSTEYFFYRATQGR